MSFFKRPAGSRPSGPRATNPCSPEAWAAFIRAGGRDSMLGLRLGDDPRIVWEPVLDVLEGRMEVFEERWVRRSARPDKAVRRGKGAIAVTEPALIWVSRAMGSDGIGGGLNGQIGAGWITEITHVEPDIVAIAYNCVDVSASYRSGGTEVGPMGAPMSSSYEISDAGRGQLAIKIARSDCEAVVQQLTEWRGAAERLEAEKRAQWVRVGTGPLDLGEIARIEEQLGMRLLGTSAEDIANGMRADVCEHPEPMAPPCDEAWITYTFKRDDDYTGLSQLTLCARCIRLHLRDD